MLRRTTIVTLLSFLAAGCAGSIDASSSGYGDGGWTSDSEKGLRSEICDNHLDDDGDGQVDEGCACDPSTTTEQWCYVGPVQTMGVGACKAGSQICVEQDEFSSWGECQGSVVPTPEICDDGIDNDCNGVVDDCQQDDPSQIDAQASAPDAGVGGADGTVSTPAAPCGPSNCAGCCGYDGICHEVPTQIYCSLGGVLCQPCNAMQYCAAQTGTCEWLKLGEDPVSVIAASALIADTGKCGAFDGCDPYAVVKIGDRYGETSTDYNDPSAVWNDFLFRVDKEVLLSTPLKVVIKDQDTLLRASDDRVAECTVQVTEAHILAGKLQFSCSNAVPNVIILLED